MDPKLKEKLHKEYEGLKSSSDQFATRLIEQIRVILSQNNIYAIVSLESRIKKWDSIERKLDVKNVAIDTIRDLSDFIGLRIILLFHKDVKRVCALISSSFNIIELEDTQDRLGTSQFGYQSIHFIARIPYAWSNLPTFVDFKDFKIEIQVRSAAQHIWAAASHILQYKQEDSVPKDVLRSVHRVSALLETVDLELERILQERNAYTQIVDLGQAKEKLNVDNLRLILDKELPSANKAAEEPYDKIFSLLRKQGIDTVGKLNEIMRSRKNMVLKKDRAIVQDLNLHGVRDDKGNISNARYLGHQYLVDRGAFYTYLGLIRRMLEKT